MGGVGLELEDSEVAGPQVMKLKHRLGFQQSLSKGM